MGVNGMQMSLNGTMWMPTTDLDTCIRVAKVFDAKTFWITADGAIKEYAMFDGRFREVEDDGKTCEAN
jgi:hypothetical protein